MCQWGTPEKGLFFFGKTMVDYGMRGSLFQADPHGDIMWSEAGIYLQLCNIGRWWNKGFAGSFFWNNGFAGSYFGPYISLTYPKKNIQKCLEIWQLSGYRLGSTALATALGRTPQKSPEFLGSPDPLITFVSLPSPAISHICWWRNSNFLWYPDFCYFLVAFWTVYIISIHLIS